MRKIRRGLALITAYLLAFGPMFYPFTAAQAFSVSNLRFESAGSQKKVSGTMNFDSSYAGGGESLTAMMLGLGIIEEVVFQQSKGYNFDTVIATGGATARIKVYSIGSAPFAGDPNMLTPGSMVIVHNNNCDQGGWGTSLTNQAMTRARPLKAYSGWINSSQNALTLSANNCSQQTTDVECANNPSNTEERIGYGRKGYLPIATLNTIPASPDRRQQRDYQPYFWVRYDGTSRESLGVPIYVDNTSDNLGSAFVRFEFNSPSGQDGFIIAALEGSSELYTQGVVPNHGVSASGRLPTASIYGEHENLATGSLDGYAIAIRVYHNSTAGDVAAGWPTLGDGRAQEKPQLFFDDNGVLGSQFCFTDVQGASRTFLSSGVSVLAPTFGGLTEGSAVELGGGNNLSSVTVEFLATGKP